MDASEFFDDMEIRDLTVQGLEEQPGKWHFYLSKPLGQADKAIIWSGGKAAVWP